MLARQGKVEIYMSPVNWGEVAYAFIHANKSRATLAALKKTLPVVFPDLTDKDAEQAGYLKEAWKLHYADAFAAALTDHLSGVLVTSDFEFKAVTGQINIEFLPKKP
jgi:predicted nucleic acid-binding protein